MTGARLIRELERRFGFSSFRPHQQDIIRAILAGEDVFAALPTGGGKSLCYQLPATISEGLTVVVSPLIALMQDQVDAAMENGIRAVVLNSSLDAEARRDAWRRLTRREVDLLYVSPERLASGEFRDHLEDWGLASVAIDEAHCISEWGHEFRQEYRSLRVLREDFPRVPIAAFTATATREVQDDIIAQLALRDPLVVRASFDRPEITYRVARRVDEREQIRSFVTARRGQSGIVYRSTRKAVDETAAMLAEAGVPVAAYHAGHDAETRRTRQAAFVNDEIEVIVATIAFGMGIDKSNVRWILHGDLPRSVEAYYQETGRAGRDGEPSEVLLLHAGKDIGTIRWHIGNIENPAEKGRAERRLQEVLGYVDGAVCRRKRLLAHFDEEHPGNCGNCDVCLGEVSVVDATVEAQKLLSAAVRTGERFGAHHLVDILLGEETDKVRQLGHHRLPTFGVGRDRDRPWWLAFARELEQGGFLERRRIEGQDRLGGFRLTDAGRMVLSGKQSVAAAAESKGGGGAGRRRGAGRTGAAADSWAHAPGTPAPSLRPDQEQLFQCLRQLRRQLARARRVPPYVVMSDRTLKAITRNRPTDRAGLLRCHGIGEAKLEQYGAAILATVRGFLAGGDCPEGLADPTLEQ